MKSRNLAAVVISSLCIAFISSCSSHENKTDEKVAAPAPTETIVLKKGKFATDLQLPGELVAFQQVDLYAKVTSFVKDLSVDIGSQVNEGQLLATLEAPELTSQLAAAESRLKSQEAIYTASKASYNRLIETSKTPGTISPNDIDIALAKQNSDLANFQAAQASYKEITSIKNYLEIRAPFTGIITARNVNPGAYVGPSGKGSELPLFTLQEQTRLRLAVSVPEAYTGYLKQDADVKFKVRSSPGETFTAKVKRRAGALDTRLRSERVEMDVTNTNKKLLPGTVAEVTIPLPGNDSTFFIPKTALVNSNEGIYIIKVASGKAERVTVKKGREADDKVEIFGPIADGDVLLLKGSEEIHTGSDVK